MINERLKQLRKELKLTQQDLANKLEVSLSNIKAIEINKQRLPIDLAEKIEKRLNVNLNWLISGKGGMFKEDLTRKAKDGTELKELMMKQFDLNEEQVTTLAKALLSKSITPKALKIFSDARNGNKEAINDLKDIAKSFEKISD